MCRCSSALGRLRTKSPNGDSGVEAAAVIASLGKLFGKDMFERAFYIALQGFTCKTRIALFQGVDHRSEEHTSELQSLMRISYAVFCLKKKTQIHIRTNTITYESRYN